MIYSMNPGAIAPNSPKFNRTARQFMTNEELNEWRALDNVSQGATSQQNLFLAGRARSRATLSEYVPSTYNRSEHKAVFRRAKRTTDRLARNVKRALESGDETNIRKAALKYFSSYDTKYIAYRTAWETMKSSDRPHVGALRELAANLDPFILEFEPAQLFYKGREWGSAGQARNRRARPLINFGINHRARQQLALKLLKTCYGEIFRGDQYCVVSRGRDRAVGQAVALMNDPNIEFVAECDVSNFFPSVGEISGPIWSTQTLRNQLPMLPRAVIDNTVLSSGVIVRMASPEGLEALDSQSYPYAKTGMPQGSPLSSYLAELIMSTIMSDAETLIPRGVPMISYVDNIGLFGTSADDVNGMIRPLVVSAGDNSFGSFDLRRSSTTRHKSRGFIFLGYYLRYDEGTAQTLVEVSDSNRSKFQTTVHNALTHCQPSNNRTREDLRSNRIRALQILSSWTESFRLVPDIGEIANEIFHDVLRDHDQQTRRYFTRMLARQS